MCKHMSFPIILCGKCSIASGTDVWFFSTMDNGNMAVNYSSRFKRSPAF